MKKQLYFKSGKARLFGVIHLPEKNVKRFGILFVHPFAEEKIISHRAYVNLANKFEEKGISCFRFDFMGHGDSEGDFEDSNIETRVSNIISAISVFRKKTGIESVIPLGMRFGATIIMLAVEKINNIKNIILISPIINGEKYFRTILRTNLAHQMTTFRAIKKNSKQLIIDLESGIPVNIDGYLVSGSFYKQIYEVNLLNANIQNLRNVLLLHFSEKSLSTPKDMNALYEILIQKNIECQIEAIAAPSVWMPSKIYNMNLDNASTNIENWLLSLNYLDQ